MFQGYFSSENACQHGYYGYNLTNSCNPNLLTSQSPREAPLTAQQSLILGPLSEVDTAALVHSDLAALSRVSADAQQAAVSKHTADLDHEIHLCV